MFLLLCAKKSDFIFESIRTWVNADLLLHAIESSSSAMPIKLKVLKKANILQGTKPIWAYSFALGRKGKENPF